MTDKDIMELDVTTLFSNETLEEVFGISDHVERERVIGLLKARAGELKVASAFKPVINQYIKKYAPNSGHAVEVVTEDMIELGLELNAYNQPKTTIDNFLKILDNDLYFISLKYNILKQSPEHEVDGKTEEWIDTDDSAARNYIEKKYKMHHVQKCNDAFNIIFKKREYHPIIKLIDGIEWDYIERMDTFLIDCAKCEDTPYIREVSRLIFAGGINRLYNKGCKFDEVPVLMGEQGCGKSTLVKWLALQEEFFTEIMEVDGQRSMEVLQGAWVCEIGELLALTKSKEAEAVKSFISRQNDRYRPAYGERVLDHKRQCIFIGTTNKEQFLNDPTGSRRFYPVKVNMDGNELYDKEDDIRYYIKMCWAEARERFKLGKLHPYASKELKETIRKEQQHATEDDYRVGLITEYLNSEVKWQNTVCVIEIWNKCLGEYYTKPSKKDSAEIGLILDRLPDWERAKETRRFPNYGMQRYWKRKEVIYKNEDLPF